MRLHNGNPSPGNLLHTRQDNTIANKVTCKSKPEHILLPYRTEHEVSEMGVSPVKVARRDGLKVMS
jgi:hypothetical protein